jgi:hypothetical protein
VYKIFFNVDERAHGSAHGMTANRFHTLDTTVDVHDNMPFTAPAARRIRAISSPMRDALK